MNIKQTIKRTIEQSKPYIIGSFLFSLLLLFAFTLGAALGKGLILLLGADLAAHLFQVFLLVLVLTGLLWFWWRIP